MKKLNLNRVALIAGVLAFPLMASAEKATDSVDVGSVVIVKYSADQAATQTGAAKLYDTLRYAATNACSTNEPRVGTLYRGYSACATSALSGAIAQIDIPAVSALHSAKAK